MEMFKDASIFIIIKVVLFCKAIEKFLFKLFPGFSRKAVRYIFKTHDVLIGGDRPWDIKVNDERFYDTVFHYTSIGTGEAYMNGWWDCEHLDEFSNRVFETRMYRFLLTPNNRFYYYLLFNVFNLQTKSRAWEVGKKHYDLGNDLFEAFLDPTLNYSCGYWKKATDLNQAQIDKMELIAQKLKLKPGMRVLDIGCGWGSLCKYLAENYMVQVVGCTISVEQVKYAQKSCEGLDVDIRLVDYRDVNEKFDRIVSVGMFEHVGEKNYRTFFQVAHRCLTDDGIFLLHTIGINHAKIPLTEPFAAKYIFPNGMLPYYRHITKYSEGLFVLEDWHSFGYYYSKTLMAWYENFNKNWPKLRPKYGDEFYRMWRFYLLMGCGMFRARKLNVWQIVFSKDGLKGGYEATR